MTRARKPLLPAEREAAGLTRIEIDFSKSLEENASIYFDQGKKAKAKAERIRKAIAATEKKLLKESKRKREGGKKAFKKRMRSWFEKFRWFHSSDGFLVIGGRDAQSNEAVVKKHMDKEDLYFHADIQGAPHCVVKTEGRAVPETTKKEAAQFAAAFSKAWPSGIVAVDVYSVKPGQVSKKAPSGESMGTGAFMIYGQREWHKKTQLRIALGVDSGGRVISGPESAVKKHSKFFVVVVQGGMKKGEVAKKAKALLEKKGVPELHPDDYISMLPAGNSELEGKP